MILILSFSFLFILKRCAPKGCRQKNFQGTKETPRPREIAPISLPPFYQWRVRRCTGHAPGVHLKRTLHQKPHVKS